MISATHSLFVLTSHGSLEPPMTELLMEHMTPAVFTEDVTALELQQGSTPVPTKGQDDENHHPDYPSLSCAPTHSGRISQVLL